ncbi:sigma-54 interaction domain-containing protein [Pseudoduganella namucuonensis]|uniref:Sigma-54 specific transcriptional regulator n=1 Tax=Pseudoduganella namucuonensis TaxID=1035707 RepID=A0A1I7M6A0_9BURK|nr:sigma-54 dependent transcriptional regulator [Pseudoduganella namucuonensis]SFV17453.1 sigma-54 specific transcriptional regulator [Pseudoduganella namucuonensis]
MDNLLTFPDTSGMALSIRAKALLFHDPRSAELLRQVERIARTDATTLIIGETGTGKELIARHIHTLSERRGPFVAVNCGAFSESLIDAELFGHEAGAFTGATQARSGWFEAANGGTLFLDEIGDLSMALQVKLLRVLQERQVVRLGARQPIPLNVRLVAATNVDLHKAVSADHFRSDLYYRLSVATVQLAPLYERPGDILPLARHFIGVYSGKLKHEGVTLSPEAQLALLEYEWPGNIRELENVIHFALIVCRDGVIQPEDLKLSGIARRQLHQHERRAAAPAPAPAPVSAPSFEGFQQRLAALVNGMIEADQADLFDTVEEGLVRTAYESCNRNQVQTARVLGISRNILRTHLKRFGLIGYDTAPLPGEDGVSGRGAELLQ